MHDIITLPEWPSIHLATNIVVTIATSLLSIMIIIWFRLERIRIKAPLKVGEAHVDEKATFLIIDCGEDRRLAAPSLATFD